LMWALGLIDELGFPDSPCDVTPMAEIIWKLDKEEELLAMSNPRSREEILDAADLILRYDWVCVEQRINASGNTAGLHPDVVMEWHYALAWLVGDRGITQWDDVNTNT